MATLKVPVTSNDHHQGNEDALITLVEYGDYQCPYCAAAHPIVKQLQKQFGEQLFLVFRNFPLVEIHPHAKIAAEAAQFAGQNDRFWEMHDLIYENQESLSLPFLLKHGERLDLSIIDMKIALDKKIYETKINSDFLGGVRSGVNGTPTFFINGQRYNGTYELEELAAAIESVLIK